MLSGNLKIFTRNRLLSPSLSVIIATISLSFQFQRYETNGDKYRHYASVAWEFAQYAMFFARTIIFHSVLILNFARTNTTGKSLLLCHAEIDFENLQLVIFFYYGDAW